MKHPFIKIIFSISLLISLASCTNQQAEFIKQIESNQCELRQQDSILTDYRTALSADLFTNTSMPAARITHDSLSHELIQKTGTMITRLKLIIIKNDELILKLKDDSSEPSKINKEYQNHLGEFELMKPELKAIQNEYKTLIK